MQIEIALAVLGRETKVLFLVSSHKQLLEELLEGASLALVLLRFIEDDSQDSLQELRVVKAVPHIESIVERSVDALDLAQSLLEVLDYLRGGASQLEDFAEVEEALPGDQLVFLSLVLALEWLGVVHKVVMQLDVPNREDRD